MKKRFTPWQKGQALKEGARVLIAMASVYDTEPKDGALWKKRARANRRYAQILKALAA